MVGTLEDREVLVERGDRIATTAGLETSQHIREQHRRPQRCETEKHWQLHALSPSPFCAP